MVFARNSLLQGQPRGDLSLRIVGTSRNGQVVRLRSSKCTIGSAAGCTLRLQVPGVRRVQCLILRGSLGTVVRSWAPGNCINGQPFTDKRLSPGDRLQVGPLVLEMLSQSPADASELDDAGQTETLVRKADLSAGWQASRVQRDRLRLARSRARRLLAGLRMWKGEAHRLRSQLAELGPAAEQPEAHSAKNEFIRRWHKLDLVQDQWEATRRVQQLALDDRDRSLSAEWMELEAARRSLAQERQEWIRARHEASAQPDTGENSHGA